MIYLTYPVLTEDPNRRDVPNHVLQLSKVRIASVTGPFSEIVKSSVQTQVRPFSWFVGSRADFDAFKSFMDMTQGRLNPFWVPTWQHDMIQKSNVLSGSSILPLLNANYTKYFWNATEDWRSHLAFIKIGTGISFIRKVITAVEDSFTQETLTLDAPVPVDVIVGQWMICFLTFCRNDSDESTLHWHGPSLAEVELMFREIPMEMP